MLHPADDLPGSSQAKAIPPKRIIKAISAVLAAPVWQTGDNEL